MQTGLLFKIIFIFNVNRLFPVVVIIALYVEFVFFEKTTTVLC